MIRAKNRKNALNVLQFIESENYDSDIYFYKGLINDDPVQYQNGIELANGNSTKCFLGLGKYKLSNQKIYEA